jgi:hypothetical protein
MIVATPHKLTGSGRDAEPILSCSSGWILPHTSPVLWGATARRRHLSGSECGGNTAFMREVDAQLKRASLHHRWLLSHLRFTYWFHDHLYQHHPRLPVTENLSKSLFCSHLFQALRSNQQSLAIPCWHWDSNCILGKS